MSDSGWRHVTTKKGKGRYININRVDMVAPGDHGCVIIFGPGENDFITVLDSPDDVLASPDAVQELRRLAVERGRPHDR